MNIDTVTDYDIQALIDNELSPEEEKRVRAYLRISAEGLSRYKELRRQKNLLKSWWQNSRMTQ